LDRLDPRGRLVAAVVFSIVVAVAQRFPTLVVALAAAAAAAVLARVSWRAVLRRLLPLNAFMLLVLVLVPLEVEGLPLATLGPLEFSREGLAVAAGIALKANAIILALAVLVGTMEITTLGHALHHLYLPEKLIHLLLFTVRYVDVLRREYGRLRAAMKVRGFRPRISRHTYRSFGYLVGMLLVRSVDRSERIEAAMKCRGFRGRFFLLDHFAFTRRDVPFAVASLAVLVLLAMAEWVHRT
jgi:cobalt/nickel transport system permease protein